ncbi:baseplate J/gp47 family protein [Achromobacter xylosoxidans]|uniref:baseplate J/gp47 family protein n=1 Tax=Alcaligenes xylosoxydans xylosoxydans TaxID=85698 RepID=UPI00047B4B71|nr:baseplate J/gp47 family protein [Achromobacter xylosoxidans]
MSTPITPYIDATGFHAPSYQDVVDYFKGKYREIYGNDIYLEADSQDGQLIGVFALAFYDCVSLSSAVYNSFSPSTSQGVGLSTNVKINGIRRRTATNSTVDLTIVGQAGTVISNGQAIDSFDNRWLLPASVTIPLSGSVTVTATAQNVGAINSAPNTVTRIGTPTMGWQSVTNPLASTPGVAVESDAELRARQTVSTALPSKSVLDGTIGAVGNVSGVTRFKGYENDTNSTSADGLPAHSIAIVAEGGSSADIAQAIAVHKTPGTYTYGTTAVTVYDQYGVPNTIRFFRPTVVPIKVVVNIQALQGYSTPYADQIKAAVAAYINALGIGTDVLYTKLYTPANLPGTASGDTFDIVSVLVARDAGTPAAANVAITISEVADCQLSNITVNVTP